MKLTKFWKGALVAGLAVSLMACDSKATDQHSSTTTSYVGKGDLTSYTIGTLGPTTGDYALYGLAVTNGVKLAVADYNKEHGTSIQVDVQDSQGDQTQAINIYNRFVSDVQVAGIVGGTTSGESYAIALQSAESGIPMITPSATLPAVTDEAGANVFRACFTDPQQAEKMAEFTFGELGLKTVATLYNADDDYATGVKEAFHKKFTELGGTVLLSEAFGNADQDFSTQLTKIAASNPEALFIPNYYEKDVQIAKQARNLGITAQLIGADGWDGVLSVTGNDSSAIEGAIFINQYSPDMENVQGIMQKYQQEFGLEINVFGINAYDSTLLLLEAIEKANSLKAEDISKTIAATEYNGILGKISFDDNGDPIKDAVFVTIKDGKYVTYGK